MITQKAKDINRTNETAPNVDDKEMRPEDLEKIEECILWAAQQGYCFAESTAKALGKYTGREMYMSQSYYNLSAFRDIK